MFTQGLESQIFDCAENASYSDIFLCFLCLVSKAQATPIIFKFETPAVVDPNSDIEKRDNMIEINMFGLIFNRILYPFDISSGIVSLTFNIKKLDQNSFHIDNLRIKNNAAHAYYGFLEQFIINDRDLLINARIALNNCL